MHIDLYWWRLRQGSGNFGDELSPWLIRKLAPQLTVRWVDPLQSEHPLMRRAEAFARSLVMTRPTGPDIRHARLHSLLSRPTLLGVGSILRRARRQNTTVWGAGLISRSDDVRAGRFLAVRGHLTREHLRSKGLPVPEAVGDPGLLAPLLHPAGARDESRVTVIPHFVHYESVLANAPDGVQVLDLTAPVEDVLEGIHGSGVTVSTSLHGVIVSHAYGIPSLWVSMLESQETPLGGDNVKFADYGSSVGLNISAPIELGELRGWTAQRLADLVGAHPEIALPDSSVIRERQRELLATAPFPIATRLDL